MKKAFLTIVALIVLLPFAKAEKRDTSLVKQVIRHGLVDAKELVISPIHWDKKDLLLFSGVAATTGALITWGDQPIYDFANTIHSPGLDVLFNNAEPLGHLYPVMAISAMLLKGLIYHESYSVETSLIAAESMFLSTVMVQAVKNTASRTRPNDAGSTNPFLWNGPFFKGNSFYSGHTTTAFSVASVFAYRYRDTGWVPILSYGLATLAGCQRIYGNRHWASDVFMGAAVGTATGIFLCKQWEKTTVKFYPALTPGGMAMSIVLPLN